MDTALSYLIGRNIINQDDIELLSQEIIQETKEILRYGSTETNTVSN